MYHGFMNKLQELLSKGHCVGAMARNANGVSVPYHDASAASFSILGACLKLRIDADIFYAKLFDFVDAERGWTLEQVIAFTDVPLVFLKGVKCGSCCS